MPVYEPENVEYAIINGHVRIVTDDGAQLPAYLAYPDLGGTFPAVALIHDWWGITMTERRLANLFAQMGYYVIIPDLFQGQTAANPRDAMMLVERLSNRGYIYVDTALRTMEQHVRVNRDVAVVGLGMGGSLAYEAALTRTDLEAAVACYGFPQRYFGHFTEAKAPILALYGGSDPFVHGPVVARLKRELSKSPLAHDVAILDGLSRDFFKDTADTLPVTALWGRITAFLQANLRRAPKPA
jgi:carboxymethylenebutenolidase